MRKMFVPICVALLLFTTPVLAGSYVNESFAYTDDDSGSGDAGGSGNTAEDPGNAYAEPEPDNSSENGDGAWNPGAGTEDGAWSYSSGDGDDTGTGNADIGYEDTGYTDPENSQPSGAWDSTSGIPSETEALTYFYILHPDAFAIEPGERLFYSGVEYTYNQQFGIYTPNGSDPNEGLYAKYIEAHRSGNFEKYMQENGKEYISYSYSDTQELNNATENGTQPENTLRDDYGYAYFKPDMSSKEGFAGKILIDIRNTNTGASSTIQIEQSNKYVKTSALPAGPYTIQRVDLINADSTESISPNPSTFTVEAGNTTEVLLLLDKNNAEDTASDNTGKTGEAAGEHKMLMWPIIVLILGLIAVGATFIYGRIKTMNE